MPVVAVASDDLVTRLDRHLHANDDGLLTDVEMAKSADQPHAVELPGLLLEPADDEHPPIGVKLLLLVEIGHFRWSFGRRAGRGGALSR